MEIKETYEKLLALKTKLETMLGEEWTKELAPEFVKPYMIELSKFLTNERKKKVIYPSSENVFNAYKLTQPSNVQIILLGMDPYINKDQAHGLSFSVESEDLPTPPSLVKIHKAIEESCYNGLNLNATNNLEYLAKQGVFLLNSVLTVEAKKSGSHFGKGWETFTDKTIEVLANREEKLVFLLFGKDAQEKCKLIDDKFHLVIKTEHPAASSYKGRAWDYKNCFVEANNFLQKERNIKILW